MMPERKRQLCSKRQVNLERRFQRTFAVLPQGQRQAVRRHSKCTSSDLAAIACDTCHTQPVHPGETESASPHFRPYLLRVLRSSLFIVTRCSVANFPAVTAEYYSF